MSRSEKEVLADLRKVCTSAGYIHALAALCFRHDFIRYTGSVEADDLLKLFGRDKLIRTEIATLIGFMLSDGIDTTLQAPSVTQNYISQSEQLLEELHETLSEPIWSALKEQLETNSPDRSLFAKGTSLREPIFYGTESAYNFQFRELASLRYAADEDWLSRKKGFTAEQAVVLFRTIVPHLHERLSSTVRNLNYLHPEQWTVLPGFCFSVADLQSRVNLSNDTVRAILEAFVLPLGQNNTTFVELNDFNAATATPIVRIGSDRYCLFQPYTLFEALYDSPFYWMLKDKSYADSASKNRGEFTETFCLQQLARVFGQGKVFSNVKLSLNKRSVAGEIDTLVTFGSRCILVQAKSKRLTIPARKGNEGAIRSDFQQSVQDAYTQALECARLIQQEECKAFGGSGVEISLADIDRIYLICAVSDHYPALSFQVNHLLQRTQTDQAPFVLDIFTLDVLAEMLDSPLRFLDYLERRLKFNDDFAMSHELTLLAYHLRGNLWNESEYNFIGLEDTISVDLDLAMLVRREGVPGERTPPGILTRFVGTPYAAIIAAIEGSSNKAVLDAGLVLLAFNGESIERFNEGVRELTRLFQKDEQPHDFSVGNDETGVTVHLNSETRGTAAKMLAEHVAWRRAKQNARFWCGLCLNPEGLPRFGYNVGTL